MGRFDYVRDVFKELGVNEHFWKVRSRLRGSSTFPENNKITRRPACAPAAGPFEMGQRPNHSKTSLRLIKYQLRLTAPAREQQDIWNMQPLTCESSTFPVNVEI